jgi:hypothetical protein
MGNTTTAATQASTFTAYKSQPSPSSDDPTDYYKFTFADDSWIQFQVSLFQSDVIDQDVIDSAVEWADFLRHNGGDDGTARDNNPLCWDQDSCGFFFDGTVIETIFTSSGELDDTSDLFGINDSDSAFYLCTMSLTE